jgi:hypothetical protein
MITSTSILARAEFELGLAYLYGEGCVKNIDLAIKHFEKSYKFGNKSALYLLETYSCSPPDNIYPNRLIHKALNGLYVRSKSEVIIANLLIQNNLEFHYEKLIQVYEKNFLRPDFTFNCYDGTTIIFEHLGMLHDEYYRKYWEKKEQVYTTIGYIKNKNLFLTQDDKDGSIDSIKIQNIIDLIKNQIQNSYHYSSE